MAIPSRHQMRLAFLRHIADGEEHCWHDLKADLADYFSLTASDRQRVDKLGNNLFYTKLARVVFYLRGEGLVELTRQRPDYRITDRGQFVLQHPPETITSTFWQQFQLPNVNAIIPVLLQYLGDREAHHYLDIRNFLTAHFEITPVQQRAINPYSGFMWNRRWGDARDELLRVYFVESAGAGYYRIEDLGFEVLQDPPEVIDRAFLRTFRPPASKVERGLLQFLADKGPTSRERLVQAYIDYMRTDTYPSGGYPWQRACGYAMGGLERAGLIAANGEGTDYQITEIGRAALILEPKEFPINFMNRVQEAAAFLPGRIG